MQIGNNICQTYAPFYGEYLYLPTSFRAPIAGMGTVLARRQHARTCASTRVRARVNTHECASTRVRARVNTHECALTRVRARFNTHECASTHSRARACVCVCVCASTHMRDNAEYVFLTFLVGLRTLARVNAHVCVTHTHVRVNARTSTLALTHARVATSGAHTKSYFW